MIDNQKNHSCACIGTLLLLISIALFVATVHKMEFAEVHQSIRQQESTSDDLTITEQYEQFVHQYHRKFLTLTEKNMRLQIFARNVREIKEIQESGKITHEIGINKFADMTEEEFKSYLGLQPHENSHEKAKKIHSKTTNSATVNVDWEAAGFLNPIQNQGQCGSCWAFSSVCSTEALYKKNGNPLTKFSEQELVDCTSSYRNTGCNGGVAQYTFEYIRQKGIHLETAYPYTSGITTMTGICKLPNITGPVYYPVKSGYVSIEYKNLDAIQDALTQQVLSVAICANSRVFQYYKKGIIRYLCCTNTDHLINLVGSGQSIEPYWRLRNSWGADWGVQGYVDFYRHTGMGTGTCGVGTDASYPE